jgi:hypothetical protein
MDNKFALKLRPPIVDSVNLVTFECTTIPGSTKLGYTTDCRTNIVLYETTATGAKRINKELIELLQTQNIFIDSLRVKYQYHDVNNQNLSVVRTNYMGFHHEFNKTYLLNLSEKIAMERGVTSDTMAYIISPEAACVRLGGTFDFIVEEGEYNYTVTPTYKIGDETYSEVEIISLWCSKIDQEAHVAYNEDTSHNSSYIEPQPSEVHSTLLDQTNQRVSSLEEKLDKLLTVLDKVLTKDVDSSS